MKFFSTNLNQSILSLYLKCLSFKVRKKIWSPNCKYVHYHICGKSAILTNLVSLQVCGFAFFLNLFADRPFLHITGNSSVINPYHGRQILNALNRLFTLMLIQIYCRPGLDLNLNKINFMAIVGIMGTLRPSL